MKRKILAILFVVGAAYSFLGSVASSSAETSIKNSMVTYAEKIEQATK